MNWAAAVVGSEFEGDPTVRRGVVLSGLGLARAYERTTVFSKLYLPGAVPPDDDLMADLVRFCEPLKKLYRAQELGLSPGETHVDRASLDTEIAKITAPLRAPGQSRGLSGPLRKLVEMHAMTVAKRWLDHAGFKYRDVSASQSCDFLGNRDGEEWVIEVKGTTGGPGSVLLTRNEVTLHREAHPRNALIIVHGIDLDAAAARVTGGELLALAPWKLEEERLSPICFEYRLASEPL